MLSALASGFRAFDSHAGRWISDPFSYDPSIACEETGSVQIFCPQPTLFSIALKQFGDHFFHLLTSPPP